jgi:hypothetical protein
MNPTAKAGGLRLGEMAPTRSGGARTRTALPDFQLEAA